MEAIFFKIVQGIAIRLLSERLFAGLLVMGMDAISKRTTNTVDDKLTRDVADALGRSDLLDKE